MPATDTLPIHPDSYSASCEVASVRSLDHKTVTALMNTHGYAVLIIETEQEGDGSVVLSPTDARRVADYLSDDQTAAPLAFAGFYNQIAIGRTQEEPAHVVMRAGSFLQHPSARLSPNDALQLADAIKRRLLEVLNS